MGIKNDAKELKGILDNIKVSLEGVNDTSGDFASNLKDTNSSLSEIAKISSDYLSNSKEITQLSSDELSALASKLEKERDLLKSKTAFLKVSRDQKLEGLEELKNQKHLIDSEVKRLSSVMHRSNTQQKFLDKQLQKQKSINSNISLEESLIDDANVALENGEKLLDKQGKSLDGIQNKLKRAAKTSKGMEGLGKALDKIDIPFANLLNPLQLINQLIQFMVGGFLEFDTIIGDTAKSMNMTYAEAEATNRAAMKISKTMVDIDGNAKELSVTFKEITKTNVALQNSLGTSVGIQDLNKGLQEGIGLMAEFEKFAGLSSDETQGILKFSLGTGKEVKSSVKELMAGYKVRGLQSKLMLNEKDAMKAISKTSKATQLSIKGGAQGLGEALAAAKALGTSLDKVDGIAGSILNFEESIASELEAELLIGRDLNLEKARQAALDNDLATLASEIAKNVGSAAEFSGMNRIQQEAIAKAVGMTREDLAASLMEQEALQAVSANSVEDAYEKLMALDSETEKQEYLNQLGNESLAKQFEQKSIQEGITASKEKEQQELVASVKSMADLGKQIQSYLDKAREVFHTLGGWKSVFVVLGGIMTMKLVKGIATFGKGLKDGLRGMRLLNKLSKSEARSSIVGGAFKMAGSAGIIGAALVGGIIASGLTYLAMADDLFSPGGGKSGYGNRTLMGPEGAIALNDKDDIVAGTDLFSKGNDVSSEGGGATKMGGAGAMSIGSDMSSVVAAINSLGAKVEAMASRPINVGVGSTQIIEATIGNNPNTVGVETGKNDFEIN
tara:strand:- start:475 stop:2838 length:2364 start_codon:yes stop_codon:yes gene_type:complete